MSDIKLSGCAESYRRAIDDPFECDGACIPDGTILVPTRKLKVWAAGSFSAPANGSASIVMRPLLGACNNALAANQAWLTYTDGTVALSAFSATSGGGYVSQNSNSPFDSSAFGTLSLRVRHVSSSIECWNETALLDREGTVFGVCEPDHATLVGSGVAAVTLYENSFAESTSDGKKKMIKWDGIKDPTELDFVDPNGAPAAGVPPSVNPCLGLITSSVTSKQVYRFRAVSHYELVGRNCPGKEDNMPDPIGSSLVNLAAGAAPKHTMLNSNSVEWRHVFKDLLKRGAKAMWPTIQSTLPYALPAAMSLATGNPAYLAASVARAPPKRPQPKQLKAKKAK